MEVKMSTYEIEKFFKKKLLEIHSRRKRTFKNQRNRKTDTHPLNLEKPIEEINYFQIDKTLNQITSIGCLNEGTPV